MSSTVNEALHKAGELLAEVQADLTKLRPTEAQIVNAKRAEAERQSLFLSAEESLRSVRLMLAGLDGNPSATEVLADAILTIADLVEAHLRSHRGGE